MANRITFYYLTMLCVYTCWLGGTLSDEKYDQTSHQTSGKNGNYDKMNDELLNDISPMEQDRIVDAIDMKTKRRKGENGSLRRRLSILESQLQDVPMLRQRITNLESDILGLKGNSNSVKTPTQEQTSTQTSCTCDGTTQKEVVSLGIQVRRLYRIMEMHQDALHGIKQDFQNQKQVVLNSADQVEKHMKRLDLVEARMLRQTMQTDRLVSDRQWLQQQLNAENHTTGILQKHVANLQYALKGVYNDHGYFYVTLDSLSNNLNISSKEQKSLESKVGLLQHLMQHILFSFESSLQNNTMWDNIFSLWLEYMESNKTFLSVQDHKPILDSSAPEQHVVLCAALEMSQCNMDMGLLKNQQNDAFVNMTQLQMQIDLLSVSIEQLKDEVRTYYRYLQSLQTQIKLLHMQTLHLRNTESSVQQLEEVVNRVSERLNVMHQGLTTLLEIDDTNENQPNLVLKTKVTTNIPRSIAIVTTTEANTVSMVPPTPSTQLTLESTSTETSSTHGSPEPILNNGNKPKHAGLKHHDLGKIDHANRVQIDITDSNSEFSEELGNFVTSSPGSHNGSQNGIQVMPGDSDVCMLKRIHVGSPRIVTSLPKVISGSWMKDPGSRRDSIYVMLDSSKVDQVYEYQNLEALRRNNASKVHNLPFRCTGTGHVIYRGYLYCHKFNTNRIVKYQLLTGKHWVKQLQGAAMGASASYSSGANTDIDFAVDEVGLWVIYASEQHAKDMTVAKLDPNSLHVGPKWITPYPKASAVNTFMVCGRLYAVSYIGDTGTDGSRTLHVDYIFDTTTGVASGDGIGIHIRAYSSSLTMLDYNPKESKLYAWDMSRDWIGQLVRYDVYFQAF